MDDQGDVLLCQTSDGGEISVVGGVAELSGGLETAVYLSLFGGNSDDAGNQDSTVGWWGNLGETPEYQYRSETQHLLQGIPATSANLLRIEDAARRDLQWFVEVGAASSVAVSATIPGVDKVAITVEVDAVGQEQKFIYYENWRVST